MWKRLIRPSWRLGITNLLVRRGRTVLLIGVVALASALVGAVSLSIDSVQESVRTRLLETLGAADARIVHLFDGRFDVSLLEEVRAWPEVSEAIGRFSSAMTLERKNGEIDPEIGMPYRVTPNTHGVDSENEQRIRPVELDAGRYPQAPDEITVDSFTAEELSATIGDTLIVKRFGTPIELTLVGIFHRPVLGALQRPQAVVLRETLEEATGKRGSLSDIAIIVNDGVDVEAFCEAHKDELPEKLTLEPAELTRTDFDRRIAMGQIASLLAALFAFLSAALLIVIGMTTGVEERQRELAIARAIGASRPHLFFSQMWFGGIIGALGGVIGVPLGIGLAALMLWYFRELVPDGLLITPRPLLLAGLGALCTGLAAGLWPAFAASRISPLRALAVRAKEPTLRGAIVLSIISLLMLAAQVGLFLMTRGDARFWWHATAGLALMELGYFLLAAPIFVLLAALLGPLVGRAMRLPPHLLTQSARATPYRLGLTAGAMMLGLAMLVSSWMSTTALLSDWLGKMRFADGFCFQRSGLSEETRATIENLPFVIRTCPISYIPLQVQGEQIFGLENVYPPNVTCIGFEPEDFFEVNHIDWVAGTPQDAIPRLKSGDGILVAKEFLITKGLTLGDELTLGAGDQMHTYEIVGVVEAAALDVATQIFGIRSTYSEHAIRCVFTDFDVLMERFGHPDVYMMQIELSRDITDEEAQKQVMEAAPGVFFISGRAIKDGIAEMGNALLAVQSAVAFAALILASFAAGNVLVANVAARRFEYGILRAVGASRSHLARLVLGEAILMGLAATIVGTLFGTHGGLCDIELYRNLMGYDLSPRIQWGAAGAGAIIMLILIVLAAIPAITGVTRRTPRELVAVGRGG
jgi:putative ABC transport system permease protein